MLKHELQTFPTIQAYEESILDFVFQEWKLHPLKLP